MHSANFLVLPATRPQYQEILFEEDEKKIVAMTHIYALFLNNKHTVLYAGRVKIRAETVVLSQPNVGRSIRDLGSVEGPF